MARNGTHHRVDAGSVELVFTLSPAAGDGRPEEGTSRLVGVKGPARSRPPRPLDDDHQRTVGHVPVGQSFPIKSFMLLFQAFIVAGRPSMTSKP